MVEATKPGPARAPVTAVSAPSVDISVIIVNYNVKHFLLQCLRSVEQALKGLSAEIIVVDNNSNDGSVAYLQPLFPSVRFIDLDKNVGFGRANNVAIEQARGDFILFLNPDTLVEEQTFTVLLAYMREHSEVGACGCKVLNPDGTLQLACRRSFPTPWVAFAKVFGLQAIFPHSRFMARYNQSYLDENATYYVDAVSGSFMFVRQQALKSIGGFDPAFFMYGEDLDFCYRLNAAGWKIAYVHTTKIIHYKGESTRRSSIDSVRVFYQAMRQFAAKHHGTSSVLFMMLRLGIALRSALAYLSRYRHSVALAIADLAAVNCVMLIATKFRFGSFLGFPPYAYPAVFVIVSAVVSGSMLAAGEYLDRKPSIRRSFTALMVTFFLLSSLTYYFKDWAFSRGILLITIAGAVVATTAFRVLSAVYDKSIGKDGDRRIAIVGMNEKTADIIQALQTAEMRNANVVGVVATSDAAAGTFRGLPVIGHIDYLGKVVEERIIQEVIVTDTSLSRRRIMELLSELAPLGVRFHVAQDYEDVVAARIINDVAGIEPSVRQYALLEPRNRLVKRLLDLTLSVLMLTVLLPVTAFFGSTLLRNLWKVVRGDYTLIGLYAIDGCPPEIGKIGLTGLAQIAGPDRLPRETIIELNEYYARNYSLVLDFDILIKRLFRSIISIR
jgi:GT2 family glycosyltransferase